MSTLEGNTPLHMNKIITDAQVREVLRADKGPEAQLSSWVTAYQIQKGDGDATLITNIKVNFTLQGKEQIVSYVVKFNSKIPEKVPDDPSHSFYRKEIGFYSDLSPALDKELKSVFLRPLNVPKCYLMDLESQNELIVLEDLQLRGFRMDDHEKGLDQAQTRLVLQELARLHAASLLLQAKTPHTDLAEQFTYLKENYTNVSEDGKESFRSAQKHGFEIAELVLRNCEGYERAEEWVKNAKDHITDIYDKHMKRKAPFEVLCHGDCWNNNILFSCNPAGEPTEMMFLDLQSCCIASPAVDFAHLFFTSVDGVVWKTHLDDFLATYYNTFTSVLEAGGMTAPFTLSELHQELKSKEEYCLLWGTFSAGLLLEESISKPGLEKNGEGISDESSGNRVEMMKETSVFRSRFLPLFDSMTN